MVDVDDETSRDYAVIGQDGYKSWETSVGRYDICVMMRTQVRFHSDVENFDMDLAVGNRCSLLHH